jgi:membrane fusion protein (multidrug efflux system)
MRRAIKTLAQAALFGAGLALCACGGGQRRPPMPDPEAGVVTIAPETAVLSTTLPGRTSPTAVADVRPQVSGIIKARLFVEGANVRQGQVLYQIDPAPYQAAYDQAKGVLASATAQAATAKAKAERYAALVKINGVSRQDEDDARAASLQADAAVEQGQAALEAARINLDYTKVKAPISGRTGRSLFTQGALVSVAQTSALTTVQTLDPIYVDITQSASDLIKLRNKIAAGAVEQGGAAAAAVSLKLEDGSDYPFKGRLEFAEVTVDQTTGAVALRAVFPNPRGELLPGLYVRAVLEEGARANAILVPAQGVTLTPTGQPTALVVGPGGVAEPRYLKTDGLVGGRWLVTDGLKVGDRLIVEGLQRIRPGVRVHAVPAGAPPKGPPAGPPGPPAHG